MGKYTEDSMELLELVGGKDNIAAVSHCMTRMRFVLGDPKKADVKRIEAMKAVLHRQGSFRSSSGTRSRSSTRISWSSPESRACPRMP